jgi:hypothetical protein
MTIRSLAAWGMLGAWGMFAAGCSATIIDGACPEGAHCVPADACPAGRPTEGDPCSAVGATCSYPFASDCQKSEDVATCSASSTWVLTVAEEGCCFDPCSCGGPCGGSCPPTIPAGGEPCNLAFASTCDYTVSTPCGDQIVTAMCTDVWEVPIPSCVPADVCGMLFSIQDCMADPTCRWLEPGCGQPPVQAGCYAAVECDATNVCPTWELCTEMVADPCWDANCNTCAETVRVCVPFQE